MKIITISRQYGAGGREIGLAVGKELGVTLYDRDIIAATAKASSIDASQIEREGEEISATESILRNITPISYDQKDYIYETQRSVILDLAKQGPCVILGRCADVVLHDAGIETLNVYIYSDEAHRAERISGYLNTTDTAEIVRAMKKKDRARRSYYEHYTGLSRRGSVRAAHLRGGEGCGKQIKKFPSRCLSAPGRRALQRRNRYGKEYEYGSARAGHLQRVCAQPYAGGDVPRRDPRS